MLFLPAEIIAFSVRNIVTRLFLLSSLLIMTSTHCSPVSSNTTLTDSLVTQKIMLDIRYFCQLPKISQNCRNPVVQLPEALESLIQKYPFAGVILFSENLQSVEQIIRLTHRLQTIAKKAGHPPLFIAVDQEGGRVVRLPEHLSTSFAGSMAIGATWAKHRDRFATLTGNIIATELKQFGINVNFAPSVDVNVNPDNPVINVRSFSEDPNVVAKLGTAQMQAMQKAGVISALKHFPGHGDTSVDSHTGLPVVTHSMETIEAVDLLPFRYAIEHAEPAMIMTAHIQYPALDSRKFNAKDGRSTILPATMSKHILSGILRGKLGYKGVIITDALDMAGIAHYFEHAEAVIKTFDAGADIALMPFSVRTVSDVPTFERLIDKVSDAVETGKLDRRLMAESVKRILTLKQQFDLGFFQQQDTQALIAAAKRNIAKDSSSQLEQELALQSIVAVKNNGLLPLSQSVKKVQMFMPDNLRCLAMKSAFKRARPDARLNCVSMAKSDFEKTMEISDSPDIVILADISPQQSLAEMGGMDDIRHWQERGDLAMRQRALHRLADDFTGQKIPTVVITLRAPYVLADFRHKSDVQLASFSYNVAPDQNADQTDMGLRGAIFDALVQVLVGQTGAAGTLPVSLKPEAESRLK